MKKKFMIYWDSTYENEKVKLVGGEPASIFKEDLGFTSEDKIILNCIDVAQTALFDEGHIIITRVE